MQIFTAHTHCTRLNDSDVIGSFSTLELAKQAAQNATGWDETLDWSQNPGNELEAECGDVTYLITCTELDLNL